MNEIGGVLKSPPAIAARQTASHYLHQGLLAIDRFKTHQDKEALHDLRVALRSLLSTLEAYAPLLGGNGVVNRDIKHLRGLMKSTSRARDAEVQAAWIKKYAPAARPTDTFNSKLLALVEERRDRWHVRMEPELDNVAKWLRRKLLPRLRVSRQMSAEERRRKPKGPAFAAYFGSIAARRLKRLSQAMAAVTTMKQPKKSHRARLEAKRLRYLLEAFKKQVAGLPPLVDELHSLQQILGELNDLRTLDKWLVKAAIKIKGAATEDVKVQSGRTLKRAKTKGFDAHKAFAGLHTNIDARRQALFAKFNTTWQSGKLDKLSRALAERLGGMLK